METIKASQVTRELRRSQGYQCSKAQLEVSRKKQARENPTRNLPPNEGHPKPKVFVLWW